MTYKAKNSLELYKGGNPSTISQLLKMQPKSIKDELKEYFGCSDSELPLRLSIGK